MRADQLVVAWSSPLITESHSHAFMTAFLPARTRVILRQVHLGITFRRIGNNDASCQTEQIICPVSVRCNELMLQLMVQVGLGQHQANTVANRPVSVVMARALQCSSSLLLNSTESWVNWWLALYLPRVAVPYSVLGEFSVWSADVCRVSTRQPHFHLYFHTLFNKSLAPKVVSFIIIIIRYKGSPLMVLSGISWTENVHSTLLSSSEETFK